MLQYKQQKQEKIKEENLRSIKLLNQYLDQIAQNNGVQSQNLRFYVSDKDNKKGRKFFLVDVHLKPLQPNATDELKQKLYDESVKTLIGSLVEQKQKADPFVKKEFMEKEEVKEKFYSEYQYEMKPLKRDHFSDTSSNQQELLNELIKQKMFSAITELKQNEMTENIQQQLLMQDDMPKSKSLLWSKLILKDTGFMSNSNFIFQQVIDPRMIYYSENLNQSQQEQFLKNIMPKTEVELQNAQKYLFKVFRDMEDESPQLFLLVGDKYSYDEIPGFFGIPFDFKCQDVYQNYSENKENIIQAREEYEDSINRIQTVSDQVKQQLNLKQIGLPQSKNIKENELIILALKRLKNLLDGRNIHYLEIKYGQNVVLENKTLKTGLVFKDQEIQSVFNK